MLCKKVDSEMAQNLSRMTRALKKLEKPRPLKLSVNANRHTIVDGHVSAVEEIMALADTVSASIANAHYDRNLQLNIAGLCNQLKHFGSQLESIYKDKLDRVFSAFRTGCRDDRLDYQSKLHLLEVIELRAVSWQMSESLSLYYRSKFNAAEMETSMPDTPTLGAPTQPLLGTAQSPTSVQPPVLSPGEVIKTSGKFAKPTKIPGKNYCKDEVVIRNSDSGKVMGIKGRRVHMIEELSETIISFQRVNPGAKERLVQITGPSEEKIDYAKQLMEDTIRRNASPCRGEQHEKERVGGSSSSINSSASDDSNRLNQGASNFKKLGHSLSTSDASIGEYKYTVTVGENSIKITGSNLELVRIAKLILDDEFANMTRENAVDPAALSNEDRDEELGRAIAASGPPLEACNRVNSLDSGATSESDETYKASPHGLNNDLEDSAEPHNIITLTANCKDNDMNEQQLPVNSQASDTLVGPIDGKITYSRESLLAISGFLASRRTPTSWENVCRECPSIVKKVTEWFDHVTYSQKWQEIDPMRCVLSITEVDIPDAE